MRLRLWLEGSRVGEKDGVLVFSVGGGSEERGVSVNLVRALETAQRAGARVFGVVGRDGGYTRAVADESVLVPVASDERVTPTPKACAVVWHLLVSHPALQAQTAKWESLR